MTQEFSRRAFLGLGAAAVAGAGLAGCAPQSTETKEEASKGTDIYGTPEFLIKPDVPQDVAETKECDVLVLGLGLAGIAAARAAAEEGARVIGVEKQADVGVVGMAGAFGVVNSEIQKSIGIEWAPKADVVNQLMKDMCYRPNPDFLNYWYDHSGEAFDWFVEGADYELVAKTADNKTTDNPNFLRPIFWPPLEGYDYKKEYYPFFHGTINLNPNMQWGCENCRDKALAAGAEFMFGTFAEQLIVDESGAVCGAYVHNADKTSYTRIDAKAVCLCTGDMGGNPDMRHYYAPQADEFGSFYSEVDVNGDFANTGDGQRMGIWAGAHMELGPYAPMTHHMGSALGVDAFLQLNMEGKRFMNEDIPGQNIADQLSRQPASKDPELAEQGTKSWQIFDANWKHELLAQGTGHGFVNYYIPEEEKGNYTTVLEGFALGYTTDEMVESAVTVKADTIEELAEAMGLPVENVVASIERYNELAAKGVDEDYGKLASRMFPIDTPPFYACRFDSAGMLVLMGGLECDTDLHPLDDAGEPINGLYVAGNTQGGRYLVEYPVTVGGHSLACALTFGRLAGTNAAKGV